MSVVADGQQKAQEGTGMDGIHGDRAGESTTNQHISWALPKAAINELSGDSPKMFTSSRQILVIKFLCLMARSKVSN